MLETAKNLQKAMKTATAGVSKPATKRTPKVSLEGQQSPNACGVCVCNTLTNYFPLITTGEEAQDPAPASPALRQA